MSPLPVVDTGSRNLRLSFMSERCLQDMDLTSIFIVKPENAGLQTLKIDLLVSRLSYPI